MQINFAEFLHVDATIKTTKRQIELPSQIALPNDQTFSKSKSDLFKKKNEKLSTSSDQKCIDNLYPKPLRLNTKSRKCV